MPRDSRGDLLLQQPGLWDSCRPWFSSLVARGALSRGPLPPLTSQALRAGPGHQPYTTSQDLLDAWYQTKLLGFEGTFFGPYLAARCTFPGEEDCECAGRGSGASPSCHTAGAFSSGVLANVEASQRPPSSFQEPTYTQFGQPFCEKLPAKRHLPSKGVAYTRQMRHKRSPRELQGRTYLRGGSKRGTCHVFQVEMKFC